MKTKDRLAEALTKAGASGTMIDRAVSGQYDDFESNSPTPVMDLVRDCRGAGLDDVALRAISGEFDGTKEEGEAWMQREGKDLMGGIN